MAQLTPDVDQAAPGPDQAAPARADRVLPPLAPRVVPPDIIDKHPQVSKGSLRWLYGGLLFSLMLVALALALAPLARATTYKWVDDHGVVHYTDKMPPEAIDKGRVELNKQGIPVKKVDPAPSIEQRRAVQAEAERLKETSKEREATERRDRALLQSYTSESEIDLARSRALATIDSQLQSSQAYLAQLTRRRAELDSKKTALGDKPSPPALERELESIQSELAKHEAFVSEKKQEVANVTARYDSDKQRWRELRAIADANAAAAAGVSSAQTARPKASTAPTRN